MKLINLLPIVLLILTVSFVSCKQGPDKLIARTWKMSEVMAKGTINDSVFQELKAELMKVEMTFKDNKYTMSSNGNVVESGTYTIDNGKLVIRTEDGMNMDATVTKERLTLDTPDFIASFQPK